MQIISVVPQPLVRGSPLRQRPNARERLRFGEPRNDAPFASRRDSTRDGDSRLRNLEQPGEEPDQLQVRGTIHRRRRDFHLERIAVEPGDMKSPGCTAIR